MASNWSSNFAAIQHTYIPTSGENTNIDDLFKKREENINVIKMIEIKDEMVDLIHKK